MKGVDQNLKALRKVLIWSCYPLKKGALRWGLKEGLKGLVQLQRGLQVQRDSFPQTKSAFSTPGRRSGLQKIQGLFLFEQKTALSTPVSRSGLTEM